MVSKFEKEKEGKKMKGLVLLPTLNPGKPQVH
jgi:hypothetical protein